jgi:hypothetical protein
MDRSATTDTARQSEHRAAAADAVVTPPRRASLPHEHGGAATSCGGSNAVAANYWVQLLVANAIAPKRAYVDAALDNLHYLLGRNAFSLSWVTAVGANSFQHPHHRPSAADANAEPWPGLLSGGPNGRKQDPAMQKLPDLPPARMYVDDQESYASNEVAINWNAPLVFLLAGSAEGEIGAGCPGGCGAQGDNGGGPEGPPYTRWIKRTPPHPTRA